MSDGINILVRKRADGPWSRVHIKTTHGFWIVLDSWFLEHIEQNADGKTLMVRCCAVMAHQFPTCWTSMRCRHLFSRTNWKKLPKDRYFQWSEEASAEWSCERMTCWGNLLQSNDFIAQFIGSHRFWLRKKCGRPAKSLPSQHPKSDDCWRLCAQPMLRSCFVIYSQIVQGRH
jgi:hypothetical protein